MGVDVEVGMVVGVVVDGGFDEVFGTWVGDDTIGTIPVGIDVVKIPSLPDKITSQIKNTASIINTVVKSPRTSYF